MKFSTRKDVEAPIDAVFGALADFEGFERAALRRGAEVERTGEGDGSVPGLGWSLRFRFRGKPRWLQCELIVIDRPNAMAFQGESGGFEFELQLNLVALSRNRTRLGVQLDVRPRTLTARIKLQSARLGKAALSRRFDTWVENFAQDLETRFKKPKYL